MKFSELKKGDRFRFFRRGTLLTKTGPNGYESAKARGMESAPDAEVLPEITDDEPSEAAPADPFGASNTVDFQHGYVRLTGAFTPEQLEAVLAAMVGPR